MSNIKMSDVFGLPITVGLKKEWALLSDTNHHVADFDGGGVNYDDGKDGDRALYAAEAINAYDANQKLEKEPSHWKANHDNVIKKLRRFTCRPDLTINSQQEEIKALKVQVNILLKAVKWCKTCHPADLIVVCDDALDRAGLNGDKEKEQDT